MTESGVIDKTALVFGQMDEPPGTRLRVALSALTMAEYFRDVQNQDVLLFIDNIFRFTQAGSEVSTLLGRMPSAVGYQPNLADEMGQLQERITSTRGHSITSLQAIYVPADDYTDPAPATTFAHLDATTELSREIASRGLYPAVDPLASTSRILDPRYVGQDALRHRDPRQVDPPAQQGAAGHHRDPRCRRAVRGGQDGRRPGPSHRAVPVPEHLHGREVHLGPRARRSRCRRPSRRSRRSPTASSTTSPSRRSTTSAASRTSSATGPGSRRTTGSDGRSRAPVPSASARRSEQGESVAHLDVDLVAADRTIWSGEASMVIAPSAEGEVGILPGHTPLLAVLRPGEVADQAALRGGRARHGRRRVRVRARQPRHRRDRRRPRGPRPATRVPPSTDRPSPG